MIKLVTERFLEKKISYSKNEYIPEANKPFCFLLTELLQNNQNYSNSYFFKIITTIDYLNSVLILLKTAIEEKEKLDIKLSDNCKRDRQSFNIFKVDDIPCSLTRKEKDGYDKIKHGKIVFKAAEQLLEFSDAPHWVRRLINEKREKISSFYNEKEHRTSFNYENVYADEISIYEFFIEDILFPGSLYQASFPFPWKNEIAKYCTAQNYFTNNGTCYFALPDDLYNHFIGDTKGRIPSFNEKNDIKTKFDKEKIEIFSKQLNELKISINTLFPLFNSKLPKANKDANRIFSKFFDTHDLPEITFAFLEKKGMIKKDKNGLFILANQHQTEVITLFCYRVKSANPEFDLYKELFSNFIRNKKEEYKKNKTKDTKYMKDKIKPLLAEMQKNL